MLTLCAPPGPGWSGLAALACAIALIGCSATEVDTRGDADLSEFRSYAWSPSPKRTGPSAEDDGLDRRIERAVEAGLAGKGLQRVAEDEASLLVRRSTAIEVKTRYNDPYFSFWLVERFEVGTLVIDLLDPRTGRAAWRGTGTHRLRQLARGVGPGEVRWVESNEARVWPVEKMVRDILTKFPAR